MERALTLTVQSRDGMRLQALLNPPAGVDTPLVVLLHGWLGRADAPCLRRASAGRAGRPRPAPGGAECEFR